jgi:hypothetical protein
MNLRLDTAATSVIVVALLGLSTLNCTQESAAEGDDGPTGSTTQAISIGVHCSAQIERPSPTSATVTIGTLMTARTNPNLICPDGAPTEKLLYRFYVEGPGGRISLQGDTGWSATRLVPFSTAELAPGRYKIYAYSMPASLKDAWLANDSVARHTSKRTGNTWFTLVDGMSWSSGDWGVCSQVCDSGTQSRTVSCVNGSGASQPDESCSSPKPDEFQACNTDACDPGAGCGAAFGCHHSGTLASVDVMSRVSMMDKFSAEPAHDVVRLDSAAARKWFSIER